MKYGPDAEHVRRKIFYVLATFRKDNVPHPIFPLPYSCILPLLGRQSVLAAEQEGRAEEGRGVPRLWWQGCEWSLEVAFWCAVNCRVLAFMAIIN